jgi:hypothetical protein
MRQFLGSIGWLSLLLLTACAASYTQAPTTVRSSALTPGPESPALDWLLTSRDIQVAQAHLCEFGFDPGPGQWYLYSPNAGGGPGLPGRIWPPGVGAPRLPDPPAAAPGPGLRQGGPIERSGGLVGVLGDTMLNAELLCQGYTQVAIFPPHVTSQALFLALPREAWEAGPGLWKSSSRRRRGMVIR